MAKAISTEIRHEVEIDTELARLWGAEGQIGNLIHSYIETIHSLVGDTSHVVNRSGRREWKRTDDEVLTMPAGTGFQAAERLAATHAKLAAARVELAALREEIATVEAQYTGWSRFFLVNNTNGHIHSSMRCSTCHYTTIFSWLPTLSGLTEGDAVAEHGPRLCSVCFPTAPVEWTVGIASDKPVCAGSGKEAAGNWKVRYVRCPDCGKTVARTSSGLIRKHA